MGLRLLLDMKHYIEEAEVAYACEYGGGETLQELIEVGYMPKLYSQVKVSIEELRSKQKQHL